MSGLQPRARALICLTLVIALGATTWYLYLDRAYGFVPLSDSALYLESALHLGAGEGVRTSIGYPILPSDQRLLPFYFHPPGSLVPYTLASLASGSDRFAVALAISLALHLSIIALLFSGVFLVTKSLVLATCVSLALALDGHLLQQTSGVATSVPFLLSAGLVTVVIAKMWPLSARHAALVGALMGITHLIRVNDLPIVGILLVALLAIGRPRSALALAAVYGAIALVTLPVVPASPSQGAVLVADTPGFEGFSPAQMDPPSLTTALVEHWPAILRKTAANILLNLRLLPEGGNPYILVPAIIATGIAAFRAHPLAMLLTGSFAASFGFASAIAVGSGYVVHFVPAFYLASALMLVMLDPAVRVRVGISLVLVSTLMFAANVQRLGDVRPNAVSLAHTYLATAARVQELSLPVETIISDAPATIALHARRRSFSIPLHLDDLQRLDSSIGGARMIVLRRGQVWDSAAFPDPAWRDAFEADRIFDFALIESIGQGDNETRLYRRP